MITLSLASRALRCSPTRAAVSSMHFCSVNMSMTDIELRTRQGWKSISTVTTRGQALHSHRNRAALLESPLARAFSSSRQFSLPPITPATPTPTATPPAPTAEPVKAEDLVPTRAQQRKIDLKILGDLLINVWPKHRRDIKLRVVLALSLLLAGKVSMGSFKFLCQPKFL